MASGVTRKKPIAIFMAFGTKGDVYPISAIAAAFASRQKQYEVAFVTHSAHEDLNGHLGTKGVEYFPIFSPPVLSSMQDNYNEGSTEEHFSMQKKEITRKHRQECLLVVESIYGENPTIDGDLIIINFFALEGWSLAELFNIRCVVAAPYVVPYSAPSSFERQFWNELPLLYEYLKQAPIGKIGWEDVIHWMWPLFSEDWGTWRSHDLHLSFWPFTDPVTGLPTWHVRPSSPLLLYGLSQEVVECPGYWPSAVRVCGFWFPPVEWQFSCASCAEISCRKLNAENKLCSMHAKLEKFLDYSAERPIFISLSSIGSMGYLRNPKAFLRVLGNVLSITNHRFILLSAGYGPLDAAIKLFAQTPSSATEQIESTEIQTCIFGGRLFCFSGAVSTELSSMLGRGYIFGCSAFSFTWVSLHGRFLIVDVDLESPVMTLKKWLCLIAGYFEDVVLLFIMVEGYILANRHFQVLRNTVGVNPKVLSSFSFANSYSISGSTATALRAGIPQVICPFILDQFYWAERMCWLGVAPEPLDRSCLVLDEDDDDTCISKAANVIVGAISFALSTEVRARATQFADRISTEDGVSRALRVIEKEILGSH